MGVQPGTECEGACEEQMTRIPFGKIPSSLTYACTRGPRSIPCHCLPSSLICGRATYCLSFAIFRLTHSRSPCHTALPGVAAQ
jgi:hypothetical protein